MSNNKEIERCDCTVIHEETVAMVRKNLPNDEILYDMADFFKVFSDSTRIRILSCLKESEMCVCDIAVLLDMSQSAISHQLRVLKEAKLVKPRKSGKIVFYSLDDEHVEHIMNAGYEHITEIIKS